MQKPDPQDEHRWLQRLVGEWTVEGEAFGAPGEPSHKMSGTETVRALGGLWMLCEGRAKLPDGTEAINMMTLGFDPAKGLFVGSFVGSMMTHFWSYDGTLDKAKDSLALIAEGPDMTGGSGMIDYRDTITFLDDDHRTLTAAAKSADGSWQDHFMTVHYRRIR